MASLEFDTAHRLELRALVERYAQAVDARDFDTVVHLFTEDGVLLSHLNPGTEHTPLERRGRDQLHHALETGLSRYRSTTHLIGGHAAELDGDVADGMTVCLAHHLYDLEGGSRMLVMAIRYEDRYAKHHGLWRFTQRRLRLEWREDRPFGGEQ